MCIQNVVLLAQGRARNRTHLYIHSYYKYMLPVSEKDALNVYSRISTCIGNQNKIRATTFSSSTCISLWIHVRTQV